MGAQRCRRTDPARPLRAERHTGNGHAGVAPRHRSRAIDGVVARCPGLRFLPICLAGSRNRRRLCRGRRDRCRCFDQHSVVSGERQLHHSRRALSRWHDPDVVARPVSRRVRRFCRHLGRHSVSDVVQPGSLRPDVCRSSSRPLRAQRRFRERHANRCAPGRIHCSGRPVDRPVRARSRSGRCRLLPFPPKRYRFAQRPRGSLQSLLYDGDRLPRALRCRGFVRQPGLRRSQRLCVLAVDGPARGGLHSRAGWPRRRRWQLHVGTLAAGSPRPVRAE